MHPLMGKSTIRAQNVNDSPIGDEPKESLFVKTGSASWPGCDSPAADGGKICC